MKVLISGGSGALGTSLRTVFRDAFCPNSKEMDITRAKAVDKAILDYKPDVLIHTAALVSVRDCEEEKEKAQKVNVGGTQNIVNALKKLNNNCYLVYMSTACVFAGENEKWVPRWYGTDSGGFAGCGVGLGGRGRQSKGNSRQRNGSTWAACERPCQGCRRYAIIPHASP